MLVTQCPACGTGFKVTLEELSIAEGELQCGQCQAYFNAEDQSKFSEDLSEGLDSVEIEMDTDQLAADVVITEATVEEPPMSPINHLKKHDVVDEVDEQRMDVDSAEFIKDLNLPEPSRAEDSVRVAAASVEAPPSAVFSERFGNLRGPEFKILLFGWSGHLWTLVLLMLLVVQLMLVFEERLYRMPKLYGLAENFCEFSGCQLNRFKDITLIKLDEVNMTPWRDGRANITARLTNGGLHEQDFPAVFFTLRDEFGRVLGARTLKSHKDYSMTDSQSLIIESGKAVRVEFVVAREDAFGAAVSYQMELVNTP